MPLSRYLPFWKRFPDESNNNSEASLTSADSMSAIEWLWRSREAKPSEAIRISNSFSGDRLGAHSKKSRWNSTFSKLPFIRWKIRDEKQQEGASEASKQQAEKVSMPPKGIPNHGSNLFHEEEFGKSVETSSLGRRLLRNEYLSEESLPMTTTILGSCVMERNEPKGKLLIEDQAAENAFSKGIRKGSESQAVSFNGDKLSHHSNNSQETGKSISKSNQNPIENPSSSLFHSNTVDFEVILGHQMECIVEAIFNGIAGSIYQILSTFPQAISKKCDRHIILDEEVQQEAFELLGHTDSLGPLTPLQMACALDDPEIAIILIDFCTATDLDQTWGRENTALHLASFQCMPDVVEKLLSRKANPNLRNLNGYRPVDCAGDKETREMFLKNRNFSLEVVQTQPVSPPKKIDTTITESGHDQNLRIKLSESPKEKSSPRHRRSNHEEQTSSLTPTESLDRGHSPRSQGSASHLSETNGEPIKKHTYGSPDDNLCPPRSPNSTNPVHVDISPVLTPHTKLPMLFDRSTIKRVNFDKSLVFLDCARNGELAEISDYLENQTIDLNVRNENGLNALHLACQHGQLEIVNILLLHGLDINSRDSENWTPLHFAVFEDYVDIVQGLLVHGPDTLIEDNDGKLAVDLAGSLHVKRLLSDYMSYSSSTSRSEAIADEIINRSCPSK
jgi:ankyrin repeat protein